MRKNLVATLFLNMGYCFMNLNHLDEAIKCFNYTLELADIASDGYLRRSQARMLDPEASLETLKSALDDASKA